MEQCETPPNEAHASLTGRTTVHRGYSAGGQELILVASRAAILDKRQR